MLVLLRGDGELDFLPVWPEAVGLLSGRYANITCFRPGIKKLVPDDVTMEHELYLLRPEQDVGGPWIFQVGDGSITSERTFTLDKIAESWILRVNTNPRTRFFLPEYQPVLSDVWSHPTITDVLGKPKPGTVWDRIVG